MDFILYSILFLKCLMKQEKIYVSAKHWLNQNWLSFFKILKILVCKKKKKSLWTGLLPPLILNWSYFPLFILQVVSQFATCFQIVPIGGTRNFLFPPSPIKRTVARDLSFYHYSRAPKENKILQGLERSKIAFRHGLQLFLTTIWSLRCKGSIA